MPSSSSCRDFQSGLVWAKDRKVGGDEAQFHGMIEFDRLVKYTGTDQDLCKKPEIFVSIFLTVDGHIKKVEEDGAVIWDKDAGDGKGKVEIATWEEDCELSSSSSSSSSSSVCDSSSFSSDCCDRVPCTVKKLEIKWDADGKIYAFTGCKAFWHRDVPPENTFGVMRGILRHPCPEEATSSSSSSSSCNPQTESYNLLEVFIGPGGEWYKVRLDQAAICQECGTCFDAFVSGGAGIPICVRLQFWGQPSASSSGPESLIVCLQLSVNLTFFPGPCLYRGDFTTDCWRIDETTEITVECSSFSGQWIVTFLDQESGSPFHTRDIAACLPSQCYELTSDELPHDCCPAAGGEIIYYSLHKRNCPTDSSFPCSDHLFGEDP